MHINIYIHIIMMTMLLLLITDQMLTCTSTYTHNNDDCADDDGYRSNVNMHINRYMLHLLFVVKDSPQSFLSCSCYLLFFSQCIVCLENGCIFKFSNDCTKTHSTIPEHVKVGQRSPVNSFVSINMKSGITTEQSLLLLHSYIFFGTSLLIFSSSLYNS